MPDNDLPFYTVYLRDQARPIPELDVITAESDAHVRALAAERLAAARHYDMAEVFDGDRLVCVIRKDDLTD